MLTSLTHLTSSKLANEFLSAKIGQKVSKILIAFFDIRSPFFSSVMIANGKSISNVLQINELLSADITCQ